jgi:hypothetical protein
VEDVGRDLDVTHLREDVGGTIEHDRIEHDRIATRALASNLR